MSQYGANLAPSQGAIWHSDASNVGGWTDAGELREPATGRLRALPVWARRGGDSRHATPAHADALTGQTSSTTYAVTQSPEEAVRRQSNATVTVPNGPKSATHESPAPASKTSVATPVVTTSPRRSCRAEAGQLVGQPRHHVERMTEHRRARAGRDELAVAGDRHRRRGEVVAAPVRDRLAADPPAVDRVVGGDAQRTDRPRLEPVVDDLDARDQRVDVLGDRGRACGHRRPVRHRRRRGRRTRPR